MTDEERQQLLRLAVGRTTVEDHKVRIEAVIPAGNGDKLRARHREPIEPRRQDATNALMHGKIPRTSVLAVGISVCVTAEENYQIS